jgi:Fe-S-cluster containining protein
MYPGKPCFFLKENKCSIYEKRPEYPCRNFECLWISDPELVPESFWPKQTDIILYDRFTPNGNSYLAIHITNGKLTAEVLDWAAQLIQFNRRDSIMYEINKEVHYLSADKNFVEEMNSNLDKNKSVDDK